MVQLRLLCSLILVTFVICKTYINNIEFQDVYKNAELFSKMLSDLMRKTIIRIINLICFMKYLDDLSFARIKTCILVSLFIQLQIVGFGQGSTNELIESFLRKVLVNEPVLVPC